MELGEKIKTLRLLSKMTQEELAKQLEVSLAPWKKGRVSAQMALKVLPSRFEALIIAPIIISMISFFLTIILFFVILFLLKKIIFALILKIFNLPVLSAINRFFGAILGIFNGILVVLFLSYLLKLIIPYLGNAPFPFDETTIYSSYIFYQFYSGNIFTYITNLFKGSR